MAVSARRQRAAPDIWPGFVDAISALLIIVIFLLMVFTLAQYFLSELLSGRDEALERLNRQIAELSEMLSLERGANAELRSNLSQLSGQLQAAIAAQDRLSSQLAEIMPDRDALAAQVADLTRERESFSALLAERTRERDDLAAKLTDAAAAGRLAAERTDKVKAELEDAFKTISADRDKIELQLRRIASMERDVAALRELREKLESRVAELAATIKARDEALAGSQREIAARDETIAARDKTLAERDKALAERAEEIARRDADLAARVTTLSERDQAIGALRDRSKELEARLADERERTLLAQKAIDEKDVQLKQLLGRAGTAETALDEEKKLSAAARRQVAALNAQIAALRQQLARLEAALEVSEAKTKEQRVQIVDLGRRLNLALASKVEELARYRSEFFGRLRQLLGDRQDIRVVGDRFVFQSEVLFTSGSAELQQEGQERIADLAKTLVEISRKIPKEINWVLRVDGHTDRIPIRTAQFPSNWELSTARAISVVRHLIAHGIPANRLAATGFGEFQPLDARDDEIAYRRNRRIEFKLTER